eukprot:scaffold69555_cov21-Tisochrysis_lutea.AAC.1
MRELLSWWELTQGFESEPGRLIGVSVGFRHHVPAVKGAGRTGSLLDRLSARIAERAVKHACWQAASLAR